jgi:hypothetical protein
VAAVGARERLPGAEEGAVREREYEQDETNPSGHWGESRGFTGSAARTGIVWAGTLNQAATGPRMTHLGDSDLNEGL